MTTKQKADGLEPSEDYINAMKYVLEGYCTDLSGQDIYDITHTLLMSGFYTGLELNLMSESRDQKVLNLDVPRGTVNSSPINEPVIKTESDFNREVATNQAQTFEYPSPLNWD